MYSAPAMLLLEYAPPTHWEVRANFVPTVQLFGYWKQEAPSGAGYASSALMVMCTMLKSVRPNSLAFAPPLAPFPTSLPRLLDMCAVPSNFQGTLVAPIVPPNLMPMPMSE